MFSKCVINEVELYYTISKRSYIIHTFSGKIDLDINKHCL